MGFYTFNLVAHSSEENTEIIQNASNSYKIMVVLEATEEVDLLNGLLTKILAAIDIDLSKDAYLVKAPNSLHNLNTLKTVKDLKIDKVLCFGLQPKQLNLNLSGSLYNPMQIGKLTFLFADSLSVLEKDASKKKALWGNLQQIFLTS